MVELRTQLAARFLFGKNATRRVSKWHRIDSDVAVRHVTRCGREMTDSPESALLSPQSVGLEAEPPEADCCKPCKEKE